MRRLPLDQAVKTPDLLWKIGAFQDLQRIMNWSQRIAQLMREDRQEFVFPTIRVAQRLL